MKVGRIEFVAHSSKSYYPTLYEGILRIYHNGEFRYFYWTK